MDPSAGDVKIDDKAECAGCTRRCAEDVLSSSEVSREWKRQRMTHVDLKEECDRQKGENNGGLVIRGSEEGDASSWSDGDTHGGVMKSGSDVELDSVSTDNCSCDGSRCSRNEYESERVPLRLRLPFGEKQKRYWGEKDIEESSRVYKEAKGRRNGREKLLVGCQRRSCSAECDKVEMCESKRRYLLRPRPRPVGRHCDRHKLESGGLQETEREKSSVIGRREKKVIEEKCEDERNEDKETQRCARVDFVYRKNERCYELTEVPKPAVSNVGSKGMRSRRNEIDLYVWPSIIHGRGVFTRGVIGKGSIIVEFVGEVIRAAISDLREKEYYEKGLQSCYMVGVVDGLVIDSTRKGCIGRFINHCCSPNSEARCEDKRIFVYALKRIKEGEEITMDYGCIDGDSGRKCCCGASNCRGVVSV